MRNVLILAGLSLVLVAGGELRAALMASEATGRVRQLGWTINNSRTPFHESLLYLPIR
jgi:hypothetical protein